MNDLVANLRAFVTHYEEVRDQYREDLAEYERGNRVVGEIRDGKTVDITKEEIADLKAKILKADQLIAANEDLIKQKRV